MRSVELRLELLRRSQNVDGGWGYLLGRESGVEPTAYALRAIGAGDSGWERGIEFLLARQEKDGGLAPRVGVPGATWVTSLAFPLLKKAGVAAKSLERAGSWILDTEGAEGGLMERFRFALGKAEVEQDPRLKGWPWRLGTSSWVEPTAHGLMALGTMDGCVPEAGIRYRREIATKMLLDRRCSDGGWNYGNRKVLGETLPGYPETTALALLGLAGSGAELGASLDAARHVFESTKGAYGRALLSLALGAHGRAVSYATLTESAHPSGNTMLAAIEVLATRGEGKGLMP